MKELRSQHKTQLSLKTRDQKRKVSEVLKEYQEEMETLKNEQEQVMKGLYIFLLLFFAMVIVY